MKKKEEFLFNKFSSSFETSVLNKNKKMSSKSKNIESYDLDYSNPVLEMADVEQFDNIENNCIHLDSSKNCNQTRASAAAYARSHSSTSTSSAVSTKKTVSICHLCNGLNQVDLILKDYDMPVPPPPPPLTSYLVNQPEENDSNEHENEEEEEDDDDEQEHESSCCSNSSSKLLLDEQLKHIEDTAKKGLSQYFEKNVLKFKIKLTFEEPLHLTDDIYLDDISMQNVDCSGGVNDVNVLTSQCSLSKNQSTEEIYDFVNNPTVKQTNKEEEIISNLNALKIQTSEPLNLQDTNVKLGLHTLDSDLENTSNDLKSNLDFFNKLSNIIDVFVGNENDANLNNNDFIEETKEAVLNHTSFESMTRKNTFNNQIKIERTQLHAIEIKDNKNVNLEMPIIEAIVRNDENDKSTKNLSFIYNNSLNNSSSNFECSQNRNDTNNLNKIVDSFISNEIEQDEVERVENFGEEDDDDDDEYNCINNNNNEDEEEEDEVLTFDNLYAKNDIFSNNQFNDKQQQHQEILSKNIVNNNSTHATDDMQFINKLNDIIDAFINK